MGMGMTTVTATAPGSTGAIRTATMGVAAGAAMAEAVMAVEMEGAVAGLTAVAGADGPTTRWR